MGEQGRREAPSHLIHSPDPYAERFPVLVLREMYWAQGPLP